MSDPLQTDAVHHHGNSCTGATGQVNEMARKCGFFFGWGSTVLALLAGVQAVVVAARAHSWAKPEGV